MSNLEIIRAATLHEAMAAVGLSAPTRPLRAGRFNRFRTGGSSASGWVKPFPDGTGAVFGDYREDSRYLWLADSETTPSRQELAEKLEQARRASEAIIRAQAIEAARKAARVLDEAKPCPDDFPYLLAKGIPPEWEKGAIRWHAGRLIIPVWDVTTEHLTTLQFIAPDGHKRFLKGGRVKGSAFPIRPHITAEIVICEGWATAVTLANARYPNAQVIAAFNAGNLAPVAWRIREKWPAAKLTIAADNDHRTEGNPGLSKAKHAALITGAKVICPPANALPEGGTDFNDLYQHLYQRKEANHG